MKENNVSLKCEPDWDLDSEKREHYITFIVNQLTLEEKTDMIHGAGSHFKLTLFSFICTFTFCAVHSAHSLSFSGSIKE